MDETTPRYLPLDPGLSPMTTPMSESADVAAFAGFPTFWTIATWLQTYQILSDPISTLPGDHGLGWGLATHCRATESNPQR